MKTGIFILHFNTDELTNKLCEVIPESIVIDNGSDIPYSGNNKTLRLEKNYGFTIGWNKAIQHFYSEFDAFWLMNSDIIISRESIERIIYLVKNNLVADIITPSYNCWMKHCNNQNSHDIRNVSVIEFTAPVIRKKVFEKIGFFNELFSKGWGVEFDFCFRAKESGFNIVVDDDSNFFHIGQQTINITKGGYNVYGTAAHNEWEHGMKKTYGDNWQLKLFKDSNFVKNIKA